MNNYPHLEPGEKRGRLTMLSVVGRSSDGRRISLFKCDCGNHKQIQEKHVKSGATKSCGCIRKETTGNNFRTHGAEQTPEYRIYKAAKSRCTNPHTKSYRNYGGRGIEFRYKDFQEFWNDLGPRPSDKHEIDRIDNESHYMPGNCHWVTREVNARNKRWSGRRPLPHN